jgi:TonB family protein
MPSRKILAFCVIISLTSHLVIISMAGLVELRGKPKMQEILTVDLSEPISEPKEKPKDDKDKKETPPPRNNPDNSSGAAVVREDTVSLSSADERYVPYLRKIRRRIDQVWSYQPYPRKAAQQIEEGTTVIKFTINRDGSVAESWIITTSGSELLDKGAISVIKAARSFEPIPANLNLTRLHIIADFVYDLK